MLVLFSIGSQKSTGSVVPDTTDIKNPKIANMLAAYDEAQYPFILISDGGVMMREDTLYDMASLMAKDVGLVHQMPFSCDKQGFAGSLEKVCSERRVLRSDVRLSLFLIMGTSLLTREDSVYDFRV